MAVDRREAETDNLLVQKARGGDKRAFAALIERHRGLLYALCLRTLGNPLLADDAAQEAVLAALLSLDRLRRPERFGPWLAGIGLNICRRLLRQRGRDAWSWEALLGGRMVREPIDVSPGPEELAEATDLRGRVLRAVAELPRGQRAAVLLFYFAGLSHVEVAAQLGIEAGAVKTRLHKARRSLRRELLILWEDGAMAEETGSSLVELQVIDVRRRPAEAERPELHVIVLQEIDGGRYLPIWVGPAEGEALAFALQKVDVPRPLTFAFAASLLQAAGGRLREVVISRLTNDTYYAEAVVEGGAGTARVDARPSDAINLAVVAGAPIRAERAVLDVAEGQREQHEAGGFSPDGQRLRTTTIGASEIVAARQAAWEKARAEWEQARTKRE